jgi:antitoxin VapB
VSLNIKNERVHALVREAATRTGKSQTRVVEEALREYLDGLEREQSRTDRLRRARETLEDLQHRIAAAGGLPMEIEDLYDENGLPA